MERNKTDLKVLEDGRGCGGASKDFLMHGNEGNTFFSTQSTISNVSPKLIIWF